MLCIFRKGKTTLPVKANKPEMGNYPQAYYLDLDLDIIGAK